MLGVISYVGLVGLALATALGLYFGLRSAKLI
jgi:hypothetical protein